MRSRHAFGFPLEDVAISPRGVDAARDIGEDDCEQVRPEKPSRVFTELERPGRRASCFPT
jgi:hypothetical protein